MRWLVGCTLITMLSTMCLILPICYAQSETRAHLAAQERIRVEQVHKFCADMWPHREYRYEQCVRDSL